MGINRFPYLFTLMESENFFLCRPWRTANIAIGIAKVRADGNSTYFWKV